MDASIVAEEIKEAFPLLPLPEMSLHQAQLADQSMAREITEAEWTAAAVLDAGKTWDRFTEKQLIACDAALSHLDEQSFVYYLPAFLLLTLRNVAVEWNHPAWEITGSTVFAVTHRSDYSLSRYARLSAAQISAIKSFLKFIAHSGSDSASDAQTALDRYWNSGSAGSRLLGP